MYVHVFASLIALASDGRKKICVHVLRSARVRCDSSQLYVFITCAICVVYTCRTLPAKLPVPVKVIIFMDVYMHVCTLYKR